MDVAFIYAQYLLVIISGFLVVTGFIYTARYLMPYVEQQTIAKRIDVIKLKRELIKEKELLKQFKRGEYENE